MYTDTISNLCTPLHCVLLSLSHTDEVRTEAAVQKAKTVSSAVSPFVYRPLRSQVRIKLHINLFVSLALSGLCSLLWETLVSESIMTDNAILHHQVRIF